jgi:hypothetical protein
VAFVGNGFGPMDLTRAERVEKILDRPFSASPFSIRRAHSAATLRRLHKTSR